MSRRTRSSRGASPQPHHPQLQFQFQRTDDHEQHLVASGPQTLTPEEEELLSSNPRELTPEKRKLRRRIQNRIAAQNSRKNKKEVVEQMHDHRDTALVLRAYCRVLVRQIRSMGAKPVPIRSTAMQDEIDRVCRSTYEPGLNSDALMMRLADEAVDIYNDEEDLDDESSQYSQGSSESEQHLEHSEISSGEESAPESLSPTLRGVQLVGGDMSPTSPPVELSDQRSHLATRSRQPSLKGSFSPVLAPITAYSQQQQQLQLQPQSQPQQSFKPVQFNALAPIYSTVPAFSAIEPLSLQVASQPGMQASSWPQQSAGNYVTLGGGYHFLAGNQLNTPSVSQQCGSEITCADAHRSMNRIVTSMTTVENAQACRVALPFPAMSATTNSTLVPALLKLKSLTRPTTVASMNLTNQHSCRLQRSNHSAPSLAVPK